MTSSDSSVQVVMIMDMPLRSTTSRLRVFWRKLLSFEATKFLPKNFKVSICLN